MKQEKPKETELEKAARKCARTGNHKDLKKYLRLRRIYRIERDTELREIKFRAWDEETETMYYSDKCWENAEATFVCESDGILKCYVPETIDATHEEPEHIVGREIFPIMQFTGQRDINNKEAYGLDIVKILGHKSRQYIFEFPILCKIMWSDESSGWLLQSINGKKSFGLYKETIFEVIGNIHQNLDLLDQDNEN